MSSPQGVLPCPPSSVSSCVVCRAVYLSFRKANAFCTLNEGFPPQTSGFPRLGGEFPRVCRPQVFLLHLRPDFLQFPDEIVDAGCVIAADREWQDQFVCRAVYSAICRPIHFLRFLQRSQRIPRTPPRLGQELWVLRGRVCNISSIESHAVVRVKSREFWKHSTHVCLYAICDV